MRLAASTSSSSKTTTYYLHVADLPKEDQHHYYWKETFIKELIKKRQENSGELPHSARKKAAQILGVHPRRINQLLDGYVAYRNEVGEELAVDYFLPKKRGPKDGRTLTDLHKAAIRLGLLKRGRVTTVEGKEHFVTIDYSLKDVYRFVQAILEEAQEHLPSQDTVRRFITTIKERHPTTHDLGLWGREAVERKFVYKRANKVLRPDARWQCDARDLPLYALVNNHPCPLCLLIIYDDFTGYIVHWMLVPKVKWDASGHPHRCNFTVRHVCTLLATAMYLTGRQPDEFYTDNGSQFVALESCLPFLVNQQGKTIILIRHKPRQPWGKGKVERALGLVNDLLSRMPGAYKKRDRETIDPARAAALPLAQVENLFADHFHHVNTRGQGRKGRKPSRYHNYWSVISAPRGSFVRMAQLDLESELTWCPINHWSFHCLGEQYEPKLNEEASNSDVYRLWLECCTSEHDARVCALKLTCGWRIEVRLRKGSEERWVEAVPKGSQQIAWQQHDHDQEVSLDGAVSEWQQFIEADEALIKERVGASPDVDIATGAYKVTRSASETEEQSVSSPPSTSPASSPSPTSEGRGPSSDDSFSRTPVQDTATANGTSTDPTEPSAKQRKQRNRPPKVQEPPVSPTEWQKSETPNMPTLPNLKDLRAAIRAKHDQ